MVGSARGLADDGGTVHRPFPQSDTHGSQRVGFSVRSTGDADSAIPVRHLRRKEFRVAVNPPTLPPDVFESIVNALAQALAREYRERHAEGGVGQPQSLPQ